MGLNESWIETVAVAVSITAGCEPCTRYHTKQARALGVPVDDLLHAVALAAGARGYAGTSSVAMSEIVSTLPDDEAMETYRKRSVLVGVGIAVCRNDRRELQTFIDSARNCSVDDTDIMQIVGLATRIKEKAASHLDRVVRRLDADPEVAVQAASACT